MNWLTPLLAASVLVLTPRVFAWEPVAGTRELGPRWSGPLIYRVHEQGSDDLARDVLLADLHKGMLEWTTPDCTSARARYDGLTGELPSVADLPGADNVIAWREFDWTHGPDTVAVTSASFISTGSGKPPQIVAASMWLNGQDWTWTTGATRERQVNAYSVFLHEGGHYWGLGHTEVPNSVMNERYSRDLRHLASDDLEGICSLYPRGRAEYCSAQACADGYECVDGNCLWTRPGAPPTEMEAGCERCDAGAGDAAADGCVADPDCVSEDERCVAGRCMHLADPPPAMCVRDAECPATEVCKAGSCVAVDAAQPGLPVGSDCVMDSDCESGLCQLVGEGAQCTDFCETDRDCGADARCLRARSGDWQTGLCRASGFGASPASPAPTDSESSGCSAAEGRSPMPAMLWLWIAASALRRLRRTPDCGTCFKAHRHRRSSEIPGRRS